MKYLSTMIRLVRLDSVKRELQRIEVNRLTVSSVFGYGVQGGHTETKTMNYEAKLSQKIRLEITANDDFLQPIIEVIKIRPISKNGRNVGNSKIFMLPLEDITRICTNENGLHTI